MEKHIKNRNKGFTIVELIVVMAIIAILILIAVPTFTKYIDTANRTSEMGSADTIFKSAVSAVVEDYVSTTHSVVEADKVVAADQPIVDSINEGVDGTVTMVVYGYTPGSEPTTGKDSTGAWEVYIPATTGKVADATSDIILIAPTSNDIYINGDIKAE